MLIIGLTGGIGSGKSTVARCFTAMGAPVIDADDVARAVVTPGNPAFDEIIAAFGPGLTGPDGQLDRARLRSIAFETPAQRRRLEGIVHPYIRVEMQHRMAALNAPYCVLVIPLLLEAGWTGLVQRILVVDAPEALQRERVRQRDGWPDAQLDAVMAAQADRATRLRAADDVIINDGDMPHLRAEVERLHQQYLHLARTPR